MESKSTVNCGCGGFLGLLTVLFIGLKLTGYIDWHWLLVLSPMLIGFGISLAILASCLIIATLAVILDR